MSLCNPPGFSAGHYKSFPVLNLSLNIQQVLNCQVIHGDVHCILWIRFQLILWPHSNC